ncbi:SusC/RagA family TonB-linked outer membrane protein [Catalinimonas niigatensis]|uniref:SusC/RagA family TonB-linked outer membrane protein n=1 Tax=Catalinimonas niigatensis TaxID=1397264 RepID=UPI0026662D11|nr:TonB-dependent receptor [Catalinimonas niigatensis]WPP51822.1 TonB-dependent receptor [Catalinimonas niigatensis]
MKPLLHSMYTLWFSGIILFIPLENQAQALTSGSTLSAQISPQQQTISGKVTEGDSGEGLPGVNVLAKGTSTGTVTGIDGSYRLTVNDDVTTLVFSSIGYLSQEVEINGRSEISIAMSADVQSLEEVVVVGYGTQQKANLTGAQGTVNMDIDLQSRPMVEMGQAMYGKMPGVQVVNGNGRPGSSTSIQIRGINSISANSSPLIVVDGIPLPNYDLNMLNPADIKSIDVLKDAASAAIYGSRGANGVVLITTLSGQSGKAKIGVNYSYSVQEAIKKIDVMDSYEYAQASIDAAQNGWIETGGDPNAPNTIEARGQYKYTWPVELENPASLPNTDWQDLIFRVAPMQKIDLNVSGGNENMNYRISGGYVNQEGIVINSDYDKYSLNFKISSKVNDWAELGGMLNIVYDHENEPFNRIVEWAVQYPSIYPVYGRNGYLGEPNSVDGFGSYNAILFRAFNGHPLYRINDDIQHKRFNGLGNIFGQVDLLPGLNFRSTLNLYYRRVDDTHYATRDHNMGPNVLTEGVMTVGQARTINYNLQNLLNYEKSFGEHQLTVLLGQEYLKDDFYSTVAERRGYSNDLVPYLSGGENIAQANDNATERTLISYFSRVNYNYKGKYIASASLRRDGSSRFGPGNKWGYFPSLSLGWFISDESFMNNLDFVSNLKLRASYGFTGNDQFDDYRWISPLSQQRVAFDSYLGATYYPSGFTNPDLGWERSQQLNLGLDIGLFENRVLLESNFYNTRSDGLLLDVPVPSVTGFTSIFKNIGELQNRGVELQLTTRNLTGALEWSTQLNYARNRNKILALGPDNAPLILSPGFGMQTINKVGEPIFSFYAYQYDGVYMNEAEVEADPAHYETAVPGDGRYVDVNKDGVLNADDRTIIGNAAPDFTWGMTNTFRFKSFDFSFLFQGLHGNDVFDNNIHRSMQYHEGRNYYQGMVNRWRSEEEPGDGYHYKLTVNLDGYEKQPSSYWIVDGSFIRMKSLTLGYTFSPSLLERINLGSVRAYFNGQNLFTISDTPVFDPENYNGGASDASRRGVAHSPYPTAKIYSLGLNVSF